MGFKRSMKQWQHRLEAFAAAKYMFIFLIAPLLSLIVVSYVLCATSMRWLMVGYLAWCYADRRVGERGARPWAWYRNHAVWRHMANYFPAELIKTAPLAKDRNYLLCCHPHGLLGIAPFLHFCTNGSDFNKRFPDIQSYAASLASQFYFPLRREIVAWLGVISASAAGISAVLQRPRGGNAVALVIGGAEEALHAHAGNYTLYLRRRRGFVRLALQNGASLVPVFTFGETETFKQLDNHEGSQLREFQSIFKRRLGICPVLFYGAGLFGFRFGILPFRRRLFTVVGAPIKVGQVAEPSEEHIDTVHARYTDALVALFEAHKQRYGVADDQHLVIT